MAVRNRLKKIAGRVTKNMTVKQAVDVFNEASTLYAQSILLQRRNLGGGVNPDPRRDIDKECGYLPNPTLDDFKQLYDRFGLAARVVHLMSEECWAVSPTVYETERPRQTPFERGWKALVDHPDLNPEYYMRLIDGLSGVGDYGGLFIGTDDGHPPDKIADGFKEDGTFANSLPTDRRLLYITPLDQTLLKVKTVVSDFRSPRNGLPQMYEVLTGSDLTTAEWKDVHWSRIVHVAETKGCSKWRAESRLRKVMDELFNCRKILGGSAEMFWKGGFPGIAATVDPRFVEAGGIDVDQQTITDEMQRFMEGLQRYILGVGFQINSLSPTVADPTAHLMMQFTMIAISLGVPLRVFMGSEEAKLASGQDIKAWNGRLAKRHKDYLTPRLVRPLVNRLIGMGVLPPPKERDQFGLPVYKVVWPDISQPDENETSTIADRRASAMMKFVMGKSYQMMQPSDFFRFVLGYTDDEVAYIMDNAKKEPEFTFIDDQIAQAESAANIQSMKDQATAATLTAGARAKAAGKTAAKAKKRPGKPPSSGSKGSPPSSLRSNRVV